MRQSGKLALSMLLALLLSLTLLPAAALAGDSEPLISMEEDAIAPEPGQAAEPEPAADSDPESAPDEPAQLTSPPLRDGYAFTLQPQSGGFDPETLRYYLHWITSFEPVRYEVWHYVSGDGWVRLVNVTNQNYMAAETGYWILPENGTGEFYVRVFFGSGEEDYVESSHITVDASTLQFTSQPDSTVFISPDTLKYEITWSTNFHASVVEIVKYGGNYFDDRVVQVAPQGNEGSYLLPASAESGRYRLNAYYYFQNDPTGEEGNGSYIISREFTISADNLAFTAQPDSTVFIDPDTLRYPIGWSTNFTPERVEICIDKSDWETVVQLAPEGRDHVYYMGPKADQRSYFILAYYDYEPENEDEGKGGHFVVSQSFTLSADNLYFTAQPDDTVFIDSDTLRYPIGWSTNFTPERVEICIDKSDWETAVQLVPGGRDHVYYMGPKADQRSYFILAYYDYEPENEDEGKGGHFVASQSFTLSADNLAFTKQPDEVVYIDPVTLQYPVSWTLNFFPPVLEIERDEGDTSSIVRELWSTSNDFTCYLPVTSERSGTYYLYAYYDYEPENEDEGKGGHGFFSRGFTLSTENLAFTDPPCIYDTEPGTGETIVRWVTSFIPTKIVIFHLEEDPEGAGETSGKTVIDAELTKGYDNVGYWVWPMEETTYYITAWYGPGENDFICREIDMETPDFGFSVSPTGGPYVEGLASFPISWATNFTPVKVRVVCGGEIVHVVTSTMNRTMTYHLPAYVGADTFCIRAWYGNGEDDFVDSDSFEMTYPGPMFTVQPQSGGASAENPWQIHWATSFEPTRQALCCLADSGEETVIGELGSAASALAIDLDTALAHRNGLFYIRAWNGEESITSTSFRVYPRLELEALTVDALDASPVIEHFEYDNEYGTWDEYAAYSNNAAGSSPVSYRLTFSAGAAVEVELCLADEQGDWLYDSDDEHTLYTSLSQGSRGLPAGILRYSDMGDPAKKTVEISTTTEALRSAFHSFAVNKGMENPDIFTVCISVTVTDGGNYDYYFKLYDIHMPLVSFEPPHEEFFDSFTLTTPLTPALSFSAAAPAIQRADVDWYTVILTAGDGFELPGAYQPEWEGQGVMDYFNPGFWSYWDENTGDWCALSVPDGFYRMFGEGVNTWGYGPQNTAPRGPDNYVFGVAANKLTRTGPTLESAAICLADLINDQNLEYFNSLPGLSPYCWMGGYWNDEDDRPEDWEETWYEYMASIDGFLTVTFADGVTYRTTMSFANGEDGGGSFHVVGEPWERPEATVKTASLTLTGQIGLNIRVQIPESITGAAGAKAILVYKGQEREEIPLDGLTPDSGTQDEYIFRYFVPAKEIANPIGLKLVDGQGETFRLVSPSGREYENGLFTYAVTDYCARVPESNTELKALTDALQNYGYYAWTYFGSDDARPTPASQPDMSAITPETLASLKFSRSGSISGLTVKSIFLELKSETTVYLRFELSNGLTADALTVTGGTVTPTDTGFIVSIGNIAAADLDTAKNITITKSGETMDITCTALSYVYTVLNHPTPGDEALVDAVRALYLYNQAANTYFKY